MMDAGSEDALFITEKIRENFGEHMRITEKIRENLGRIKSEIHMRRFSKIILTNILNEGERQCVVLFGT